MDRLSKVIMAIGAIIALLAVCCIDSPGVYGYLAGGVAILGGFIVGAGYGLGLLAERRRVYRLYLVKVVEPDVVWIEEGGSSLTNAQCLIGETMPLVEDMAVGMIICKVADDFCIEIEAERYIPLYHSMKNWLLEEKAQKNSTVGNFGESRCYLGSGDT